MIRDDMIEEMERFWKSIPDDASNYHVFDMLLSRMERLGMLPPSFLEWQGPATEVSCDPYMKVNKWEDEDETKEIKKDS